jgi:hypothetical protein
MESDMDEFVAGFVVQGSVSQSKFCTWVLNLYPCIKFCASA